MLFQIILVRQQTIERPIQSIVVDLLLGKSEEIIERRATIPILGDMEFTGRLAETRDNQHRSHNVPGNVLASTWHPLRQPIVKSQGLPDLPCHPHITEAAVAFQAQLAYIDVDWRRAAIFLEQATLTINTGKRLREISRSDTSFGVEFPELSDCLLPNLAAHPNRTHQPPILVNLAVFANRCVTQVHVRLLETNMIFPPKSQISRE